MISKFNDFLGEGKVRVKRRYTENYPSKHVYSGASIRNAVLSAIKDGVVTEEEFQKILDEAGASRIWKYKYSHFFDVNEEGVRLSSKGLKLCPAEKVEEASTSIAQQRLMGMAYALKTGDMDPEDASDEVKDLARSMTTQQLKDFASTKHKGLPYKKENESLTLSEVPGMGDVKLPGNPGATTDFDNQQAGSGDIPFPIPNKKKTIKIMKLIPESFEEFKESLITEAFNSSILQNLTKGRSDLNKKFFDALSKMGIAASDIEDDQIIELTPDDAKKYTKQNPSAILIYYSTTEKPNPFAGSGAWSDSKTTPAATPLAIVKDKLFMGLKFDRWSKSTKPEYSMVPMKSAGSSVGVDKSGGTYGSGLTTLDKMAAVSDVVYAIDPTRVPSSSSTRSGRSSARSGAAAYISDKDFKAQNKARYDAILADKASKLPIDKEVGEAIDILTSHIKDAISLGAKTRYGEILIGTDPKGREIKISDASNIMRNLLDDFGRYVDYVNQSSTEEGRRYYEAESKKYAKSITDRLRKIKNKDYAW